MRKEAEGYGIYYKASFQYKYKYKYKDVERNLPTSYR